MKKPIVQLQKVSRSYDNGRIQAVSDVSLDIYEHESVAVLGSSGSGKTTLLNLITGIDLPDDGKVLFNGRQVKNKKEWCQLRSASIGFIFQSFNLIPTLTALENVEVPMFGNGLSAPERIQRASNLLDRVGLSHRMSHLPNMLSGGERQRAAIARSLANKPGLLVADEPTGNLDSQTAVQIMNLISALRNLWKNTLILVTHDEKIAKKADRIVRMTDGRIADDQIRKL